MPEAAPAGPVSLAPSPPLAEPISRSAWPPVPPKIAAEFCTDVLSALDESTCYVLPAAPTQELIIYLHGILPPTKTSAVKTNFQKVVASASQRAGVAALIPRGRRGLAPKGHEQWWGWPTTPAAHARFAQEIVAELMSKRLKLETLTGSRFSRLYVAGSSSGAYFAVGLALGRELEADGFAVLSGGADLPSVALRGLLPKPVYIGYGIQDSVGSAARSLAERLKSAGWPVRLSPHPGGHGAKEVYLDEAFAFWRDN